MAVQHCAVDYVGSAKNGMSRRYSKHKSDLRARYWAACGLARHFGHHHQEEMEEAANGGQTGKTQGIRQLVDTMKRISDERRELEVAAKSSESTVAQMEQDKLEMITVGAEKEIGMKNELAELRGTCRPIPCSCCGPGI